MSNRKRVASAAAIIASLYMVSRVLGFVRLAIFTTYFGIGSDAADAYWFVSPIPDLIFNVIAGGALGSAFIPMFSTFWSDEDNPDTAGAWELFSTIVNLVLIVVTVVSVMTALFASFILQTWYGADTFVGRPELLSNAVLLLRVWLISTVIFGASGVMMVTLNARQHFLMPALATVVYNIGIIGGIVLFQPNVVGVGIGAAVGALGHLLIQIPAFRSVGGVYRVQIRMTKAVRQVGLLMAPRVLGLSFSYLNLLIIPRLAAPLVAGSLGALVLGSRIMLLPQSVLGQAIGVASFPTFATLAAQKNYSEMRMILSNTLRFMLFVGLPIAAGMMLVRTPLSTLAFQYGKVNADDAELVAFALLFYALALVALSMIEVLVRAFYALHDTWTPVVAGLVQMMLLFGLGWWLGQIVFPANNWFGLGGIALAYTVANCIETVILMILLRRKMGGIGAADILNGGARMALATAGMAAGVWFCIQMMTDLHSLGGLLVQLAVCGVIGLILYSALCYILNVRELRQIGGMALTRMRQR